MAISTVKATINGTEYTLTYNGASGKYEATLTAPVVTSRNQPGGYYDVSVKATDVAGNQTTKSGAADVTCRLVVKEKVKPTISSVSPSNGTYSTSTSVTISGQVLDEAPGSGIDPATFKLKIDGAADLLYNSAGMTWSPISGGYIFSYTKAGLTDGAHTFTVNVSDQDGNVATAYAGNFTVDTVPPSLTVTSPVDGFITNNATLSVAGSSSDALSGLSHVKIKLNGLDQGVVTVTSGNFTRSVTLSAGVNTIVVTATDTAGKFTEVTRTVTLDTVAPTITSIELIPNPVDAGATFIVKVTATDA